MKTVEWHEALLAIENEDGVVLLLTQDHAPSRLLADRLRTLASRYSNRGYVTLACPVTEDCAPHPELAAVRLPQIRVFASGEEVRRLVGVQDEDVLDSLV